MKEWLQYTVILIVASVLSFYLTGIFNPFVRYEVRVSVQASPGDVWASYADTTVLREWMDGLKEITVLSGDSLRTGTSYRLVVVQNGDRYELTQTVVKVDSPQSIEYHVENDILINDMRVDFVPQDSATSVSVKNKVTGKSFFRRAMFTIFKYRLAEHQQRDYERFRSVVNSRRP